MELRSQGLGLQASFRFTKVFSMLGGKNPPLVEYFLKNLGPKNWKKGLLNAPVQQLEYRPSALSPNPDTHTGHRVFIQPGMNIRHETQRKPVTRTPEL